MRSARKPKISAEKKRELQVAAAVAREALLHTHVNGAIELIDLAGDRVSAVRMLDIHLRVNGVPPVDAEVISTRVLALLGEEMYRGGKPRVYVEGEAGLAGGVPLLGVLRERLRGRSLDDLRRWVELHTGRTQIALLDVHVTHALRFVELLRETHTIPAAIGEYESLIAVPRAFTETLHVFVLERLAVDGLPAGPHAEQVSLFAGPAEPQAPEPSTRDRRRKRA